MDWMDFEGQKIIIATFLPGWMALGLKEEEEEEKTMTHPQPFDFSGFQG